MSVNKKRLLIVVDVNLFLDKIWYHKGKFEGDKCKTCLALDWVEDALKESTVKEDVKL